MTTRIRNAKYELLSMMDHITWLYNDSKYECRIRCAEVSIKGFDYKLRTNHTEEDYLIFLDSLDEKYDSFYQDLDEESSCVTEDLSGTVWFEDGSWLRRTYYREGRHLGKWVYNNAPDIPGHLL